ncbi:hypothetical protein D3C84_261040 [compost metagenome]
MVDHFLDECSRWAGFVFHQVVVNEQQVVELICAQLTNLGPGSQFDFTLTSDPGLNF